MLQFGTMDAYVVGHIEFMLLALSTIKVTHKYQSNCQSVTE